MYTRTAAAPSAQALAQAAACRTWGAGPAGREVLPHPVCKGKYAPWRNGERMYGCFRHHAMRKKRIAKAGVRAGWESFEQWPPPPPDEGSAA
mmetsp:Transcript_52192/g.174251  ORF Transcript_52192/g.174251 Transcript_52192/m.174251 type:complete len:92 (-) Transcript_52192:272-547(-)